MVPKLAGFQVGKKSPHSVKKYKRITDPAFPTQVKSVKTGSLFWAAMASLSYFYMVSAWGGYVYIINLIPLHVFALLLMGRFSHRLYTAYTTFYILGLICSMQIPFVGFQPIRTSEHMAAAGVYMCVFEREEIL